MDQNDKRGLQRNAYDTSGGHMHGAGQTSVESNHRRAANTSNDITWAIKVEEKNYPLAQKYKSFFLLKVI